MRSDRGGRAPLLVRRPAHTSATPRPGAAAPTPQQAPADRFAAARSTRTSTRPVCGSSTRPNRDTLAVERRRLRIRAVTADPNPHPMPAPGRISQSSPERATGCRNSDYVARAGPRKAEPGQKARLDRRGPQPTKRPAIAPRPRGGDCPRRRRRSHQAECPGRVSNPHAFVRQPLLRRPCLPFHHPGGRVTPYRLPPGRWNRTSGLRPPPARDPRAGRPAESRG